MAIRKHSFWIAQPKANIISAITILPIPPDSDKMEGMWGTVFLHLFCYDSIVSKKCFLGVACHTVWGRICEVDRAGKASVRDKRSLTLGIGMFGKDSGGAFVVTLRETRFRGSAVAFLYLSPTSDHIRIYLSNLFVD